MTNTVLNDIYSYPLEGATKMKQLARLSFKFIDPTTLMTTTTTTTMTTTTTTMMMTMYVVPSYICGKIFMKIRLVVFT